MRVAAVDLGTNTTRLLVADVEHGLLDPIVRREAITRLGESVDRRRILLPTAIARVRNVLVDYRREAEALGAERVLAVGTSAVRDADNGEAFLGEVEWSYGFVTRLLDGGEEAELMLRGVASDLTLGAGTLVIDIGGGSTELVTTGSTPARVGDEHRGGQRPAHRAVPRRRPAAPRPSSKRARTTSARSSRRSTSSGQSASRAPSRRPRRSRQTGRRRCTGTGCGTEAIAGILERLAALPLAERQQVTGLDPARAPVIVAGLVVLHTILERYGLDSIEVSERDLLEGAALAAAELPEPAEGPVPPTAFTCC